MLDVGGERARTLAVGRRPRVVAETEIVGGGVHQAVGVERERHVVVDVGERAIGVPVPADPVAVEQVERRRDLGRVERRADALEAERDEHPEELPVVRVRVVLEDPVQPRDETVTGGRRQRLPGVFRAEREREADRGLFDHPLVVVSGDRAPVLRRVGVGARVEAVDDAVPVREVVAAEGEGHDAVQRPSEPFELGGRLLEHRREAAEADPGPAGAGVSEQRFVQVDDRTGDVVAGLQRAQRERVGARPTPPIHLVHGRHWSAHCLGMQMRDHRPALLIAHHPSLDLLDQDALDRIGDVAVILDREPVGDWDDPRSGDLLARAEVILGHWGCPPLDASVIDRAPKLGLFAYAAGTVKQTISPDVFDRAIRVTSGADANAEPVAEFTLATILYANKDVIWQRDVRRTPRDPSLREFRRPHGVAVGNYDKTIGIVGASLIGRRVIELLGAFPHLDVALYDPFVNDAEANGARCHEDGTRRTLRERRHPVDPRTGPSEHAAHDRSRPSSPRSGPGRP